MKKNIFILGARGYKANYGGWETFVTNLVDNYKEKNTTIYVSKLTDNPEQDQQLEKINKNLYLIPIYIKTKKSPKMFFYTMKAYQYTLKYIKTQKLSNPYIYVLGLKLGPLLQFKKHYRKKHNIKILVNPDGLEHRRSKWNKIIQYCFLLSEWSMINNCDQVVCDALGIQEYITKKYKKAQTTYIAYGAKKEDLSDQNEEQVLKEYHLKKDNYCLMVGRCVPENNYELVIKEFMNSTIQKDLVIITNLSTSTYYQELLEKTNFSNDPRIHFINGVYDQKKLAIIRKNAYLYIHGHSVGGTNPSLIEALSLTDLNILYDVCFNHDIGTNTCLYFQEECSLTKLLNNQKLLEQKKQELAPLAKKLVKDNYTWEKIVSKYQKIFK